MNEYLHLLGVPYLEGKDDCYGLVRAYFKHNYQVVLPNYARPLAFDHGGIDLIGTLKNNEDCEIVPMAKAFFKTGDVLIFSVRSDRDNHFGIYVGNNMFIHHLINRRSEESNIDSVWFNRLTTVLRHKEAKQTETKSVWDFLTDQQKGKFNV